jgi:hypothetical protein
MRLEELGKLIKSVHLIGSRNSDVHAYSKGRYVKKINVIYDNTTQARET